MPYRVEDSAKADGWVYLPFIVDSNVTSCGWTTANKTTCRVGPICSINSGNITVRHLKYQSCHSYYVLTVNTNHCIWQLEFLLKGSQTMFQKIILLSCPNPPILKEAFLSVWPDVEEEGALRRGPRCQLRREHDEGRLCHCCLVSWCTPRHGLRWRMSARATDMIMCTVHH